MNPLRCFLPWPPTLNHLYPRAKHGRRYLSPEGKRYKAGAVAVLQSHTTGNAAFPLVHAQVRIIAFPPDRRRRDLANLEKIVGDSLETAGVVDDDALIERLVIERGPVRETGAVAIEATAVDIHEQRRRLSKEVSHDWPDETE